MTTVPTPITRSDTTAARIMATAWMSYDAALWRGDPAVSAFAEWLAGFWEPALERPSGAPDARNAHAAGGRGIDWFERDGFVSGHVAGRPGGYLVPRAIVLACPWAVTMAPAA
jgi:hypothetical protein